MGGEAAIAERLARWRQLKQKAGNVVKQGDEP
jgi:hypothetical protein